MSAGLRPHPLITPQCRQERRGIPGADQVTNPGTLLALIGPDPQGLRQVTVTTAEPTPDTELSSASRRTALRVPEPQFPHRLRLTAGRAAAPHRFLFLLATSRIPLLRPE
jgi:hypothetical protein